MPLHLRHCLMRCSLVAMLVGGTLLPEATAGVRISRVVVDGQEVPLSADSGENGRLPVELPARSHSIEITYTGGGGGNPPSNEPASATQMARGTRLRHRLDGVDADWRDSPAKARVLMQFLDADRNMLDSHETTLQGESAGWQGAAEVSDFHEHTLSATAPPLTERVVVSFLSHGGEEVVGQIGIDDVALAVEPAAGGEAVRHAFPVSVAGDQFNRLESPSGWTRRGSRGQIAQVRLRATPLPHPILVLLDDNPTRFGNWSLIDGAAAAPGDRVTLSWKASHSLGVGGTAVASYRDLPPGTYVFRAGAFRPGGQPAGHETSLAIQVVVPWYERPQVWLGGIAIAGGVAFAIGRSLSLRRVKRRLEELERAHALERERTRIARDLHDEIGAGLTEIAMQNFWARREMEGSASPAAIDRVEKARQSAVDLVRSVDAIVWAVNPANDTLDRFMPYLTHSVEQFLDAAGVQPRIDVPDHLPSVTLEGATRHSLFLVVREAVNNAVKHAAPTSVWLTARVADGRLAITVEDDGQGFTGDAVPPTAGRGGDRSGLGNMRRRVEELGGTFSLENRAGGGTRVAIDVPLPVESLTAVS